MNVVINQLDRIVGDTLQTILMRWGGFSLLLAFTVVCLLLLSKRYTEQIDDIFPLHSWNFKQYWCSSVCRHGPPSSPSHATPLQTPVSSQLFTWTILAGPFAWTFPIMFTLVYSNSSSYLCVEEAVMIAKRVFWVSSGLKVPSEDLIATWVQVV